MSPHANHPSPMEKRARARQVRDAFPRMGVYAIRDLDSGNVIVGSSRNVDGAINRARFELRMGSHANKALQAAWTSSRTQRFTFEILELLHEREDTAFDYAEELRMLEQLYREELGKEGATR